MSEPASIDSIATHPSLDGESGGTAAERREAPPAGVPLPSLSDFNSNELMMRSICAVGEKRAKSIRLPKGCVNADDGILFNQEFFEEGVGFVHGDVPGVWMQVFQDGSTFTEFVEGFEMVSGARWNQLQPGHKKSAFCLFENIRVMFDRYGLENFGFETFTFPRKVHDIREAQRHWNSLNTGVYRKLHSPAIMTPERHKDGGVHFHCIVHLGHDVRTGFDFAQVADKTLPRKVRYQSVCPWLKERWRLWRDELCPR